MGKRSQGWIRVGLLLLVLFKICSRQDGAACLDGLSVGVSGISPGVALFLLFWIFIIAKESVALCLVFMHQSGIQTLTV